MFSSNSIKGMELVMDILQNNNKKLGKIKAQGLMMYVRCTSCTGEAAIL